MLYPARPDAPLSVEDDQEREIVEGIVVETARFWGTVGITESTVTVVVAVLVPFVLVAMRV
jgi:hypothetical protein